METERLINERNEGNGHRDNDYRAHTCGILIFVAFLAVISAGQFAFFAVMTWETYNFAHTELPAIKSDLRYFQNNITNFASRIESVMNSINTNIDMLAPGLGLIAKCSCNTEKCMCNKK